MSASASIPQVQHFVQRTLMLLSTQQDETVFLPKVAGFMRDLVASDDWLPALYTRPHPQFYQQYPLYEDEQDRLSVVSFVWGPGQATPIHDHTVWGVIGMLRGAELGQRYTVGADGKPVVQGEEHRLTPGQVESVSPDIGDVHRVRNAYADRVSISIHAYGGNIGKIRRHVYLPGGERKEFVSGYSSPDA